MVNPPRQRSVAAQNARRAELDAIRLERPLTDDERAEDDRLANALYLRTYRASHRERFGRPYACPSRRQASQQRSTV